MRSHAPSSWAWRSTYSTAQLQMHTRRPRGRESIAKVQTFRAFPPPLTVQHTPSRTLTHHTRSRKEAKRAGASSLYYPGWRQRQVRPPAACQRQQQQHLCNGCQSAAHSGLLLRCRQHRHGTGRRPPDPTVRCNPPTACAASPLHTCCGELTVVWPEWPLIAALHSRTSRT
jgi:hypothetical protein